MLFPTYAANHFRLLYYTPSDNVVHVLDSIKSSRAKERAVARSDIVRHVRNWNAHLSRLSLHPASLQEPAREV